MDREFPHNKKILLVDDEPELLRLVTTILSEDGFIHLLPAATFREGLLLAQREQPDLAILDICLSDGDGFSLLRELRTWTDIPAIFLTARDEASDRLAGLGLGADDYIAKPFLPQELLLRVHAVLRRCYKEDAAVWTLADSTVDFGRAQVRRGDESFALTAMEHKLLETLARNNGRIVTIDALCEALWGDNPFGYENSLNAHVRRIREKIEADPSKPKSLLTVKGLGYKLLARK